MVARIRPLSLSILAVGLLSLGPLGFAQPRGQNPLDEAVAKEQQKIDDNARTPSNQDQRETAIRALGRLGSPAAVDVMVPLLGDPFEHIRELTVVCLAGGDNARYYPGLRDADAIERLIESGLSHESPIVRQNACEAIARLGETSTVKAKVDDIADKIRREREDAVKAAICRCLGRIGAATDDVIAALDRSAGRGRGVEKAAAIVALAQLGKFDKLDPSRLLRDRDTDVKVALIEACAIAGDKLADVATEVLNDRRADVPARVAAAVALEKLFLLNADTAMSLAEKAVADDDWRVRAAAIDALAKMWHKRAIPALIARLEAETGRLKLDAFLRLRFLTAKEFGIDAAQWKTWWNSQGANFELREKPEPGPWGLDFTSTDFGDASASASFFNIPVLTRAMYFMLDTSGSMGNPASDRRGSPRKIDFAAKRARETLDALPEDAKYNLVLFRYYSAFPPRTAIEAAFTERNPREGESPLLYPVNRRTTQRVEDFIRAVQIEGWGDYWGAFDAAMKNPEVDTIFWLSDGKPTRGEHIRDDEFLKALIEKNRYRRLVINTVLTGTANADADFMRNIAIATGGLFAQVDLSKEDK